MKLYIFDVDGTLTANRPTSITSFERTLLPNVEETCKELIDGGATLAIASNQGGLKKGLPVSEVYRHFDWLSAKIGFSAYRFASGKVSWFKKPAGGMLVLLMRYFEVMPQDTVFVGDSPDDQAAAKAAGCGFVWAWDFFGWEGELRKFQIIG